jgi:hypothetical protein
MCPVMAAFTIQSTIASGQPVQGAGIFTVLAAATIAAARLIMPGAVFGSHGLHEISWTQILLKGGKTDMVEYSRS